MLKNILFAAILGCFACTLFAQQRTPRKIFISVDMEGITGVASSQQSGNAGSDYNAFRRIMTEEVNAAIEAALAAGAETFRVSDAHGNKQNILPELLHPRAELVRGDPRPLGMMQGIDATFDAAIFIGFHAMAGTPNAVLDHTMTGGIYNLRLDGKPMSEGTFNAAVAGSFNVPVIFISGDRAAVQQLKEFVGDVETAAVKEGVEEATITVSPERGRTMIREGVTRAIQRFSQFRPYKVTGPHRVEIDFSSESATTLATWVPGVSRTSPRTVAFDAKDMSEAMRLTRLLAIYVKP
jgi:D-amino peptidase